MPGSANAAGYGLPVNLDLVDRCGPIVAALIGGVLAGLALRESEVLDHTIAAKDGLSGVLVTPQWAGTIAAVVAVAVLTMLLRLRSGIGAAATALVGAAAIGLPAVVAVATEPALTLNAVGAGLMLGAAAYPTAGRRAPLIALALGVLAATVFFGVARLWRVPAQRWSVARYDNRRSCCCWIRKVDVATAARYEKAPRTSGLRGFHVLTEISGSGVTLQSVPPPHRGGSKP